MVTHPHEDHHKGFEEEFFGDLQIDRIWLSPAFDRANPKAQGFHALQDAAQRALQGLTEVALGEMKEEVEELLSLSKSEAIDMLCNTRHKNGTKRSTFQDTLRELKIHRSKDRQCALTEISMPITWAVRLLNAPTAGPRNGDGYQLCF
jgi:hypothetical protein